MSPMVAPTVKAPRTWSVQSVLLTSGAVLMPLGLIAIWIGWYGAAHAKYGYDQFPYLISGGLLGVGLLIIGGFLYFGSWLAKIANDQVAISREILAALTALQDRPATAASREPGTSEPSAGGLVVAARGKTLHRVDCALVSGRHDLRTATPSDRNLVPCRVCHPNQEKPNRNARTQHVQ
jgi:hypothetical protein